MSFRPAVYIPLILAGLGLVFLCVAPWMLFNKSAQRDLERGLSLASATAATMSAHAVGETVLVEGRLAASNRSVFREFVACQRDRYLGEETSGVNKGKERWEPMETLAPPLQVETADGTVAIINQAYALRGSTHRWWDKGDRTNLTAKQGERAAGFFAGDQVTVEGRVAAMAVNGTVSARALEAQVLSGGDRTAYLDYLRGSVLATRIIGGVFLGVGALLMLIGGGLLWRALRNKNGNLNEKEKGDEEDNEFEDEGEDQHEDDDEDEDQDEGENEKENKKHPTRR
jgi:hypothetical protein